MAKLEVSVGGRLGYLGVAGEVKVVVKDESERGGRHQNICALVRSRLSLNHHTCYTDASRRPPRTTSNTQDILLRSKVKEIQYIKQLLHLYV